MNLLKLITTVSVLSLSISLHATSRPPQFVNMAFDGSKSLRMWKYTTEFATQENIKFTYFISGVYFVDDANKHIYQGPNRAAGSSDIGFGGNSNSVKARNSWVQHAYQLGHEIASHANGHFNGGLWNSNEWDSELRQFEYLLTQSQANYGGADNRVWNRGLMKDMIGFRAPLLGRNNPMYQALQQNGYRYDTSSVRPANQWPTRINALWDFPLASLKMNDSGKTTLSMDYNMYVAQSNGVKGEEAFFNQWEEEVYQTYLKYFKANYLGNRAPLHIGHHFSLWNGGIYWRALQRFAQTVCQIPEVICGTYTDLVNFLERQNARDLQDYQAGRFTRASLQSLPPEFINVSRVNWSEESISLKELRELEKHVCPAEAHKDDGVEEGFIGNGTYL